MVTLFSAALVVDLKIDWAGVDILAWPMRPTSVISTTIKMVVVRRINILFIPVCSF
jgi:hypothetical protein